MRFALVMVVGALYGSIASADTVQSCISIENNLDRLACYDKASGRTPVVKESVGISEWRVRSEQSQITDDLTVLLTVDSEEIVSCSHSDNERPKLIVRCHENTTSMILATDNCHLTSSKYDSYGKVDFRLDDQKSMKISMEASTNRRALGLWSGGRSIPIIKKMMTAETAVMRFTPYGESPKIVTFEIGGLSESVKPLREACSW